jgi:N-acetylglutamate synthase-like GNAT family acetyltransferase
LSIVRSLRTPGAESTPAAPASEFALDPPDGKGIFSNLYDDRDGLERCLADRFDRYEIELCRSVAFFAGSTARAVRCRIRLWDPADHDQVIALIVGIQRGEFNLPITAADQPDLADITGFYRAGGGEFWVARHHGSVVGTIAALRIGKHIAVLRKMFVAREHRGASGPATTLMQTLIGWSEARGIRTIFLGTTAGMRAAHRFYARHAFESIDPQELPANFPRMDVDTRFYRRDLATARTSNGLGHEIS